MVELIKEDLGSEPAVVNVDAKFGSQKRTIELNKPNSQNGVQMLDNDVQRALFKVALEDVPSTPTYRAQQLMMLTEMTKSLPPNIQQFVIPFILESSEMPHRREVADQVRKALGIDTSNGGEQTFTKEQVQQIVQQQVELAQQNSLLGLKVRETAVKEFDAETKRIAAEAGKYGVTNTLDIKMLDTLLKHDQTTQPGPLNDAKKGVQGLTPATATPTQGAQQ